MLENLDISPFIILPSYVYIRNITDVDIKTSAKPKVGSKTATLNKIQVLQFVLKDISFWYKDTRGGLRPRLLAQGRRARGCDGQARLDVWREVDLERRTGSSCRRARSG